MNQEKKLVEIVWNRDGEHYYRRDTGEKVDPKPVGNIQNTLVSTSIMSSDEIDYNMLENEARKWAQYHPDPDAFLGNVDTIVLASARTSYWSSDSCRSDGRYPASFMYFKLERK